MSVNMLILSSSLLVGGYILYKLLPQKHQTPQNSGNSKLETPQNQENSKPETLNGLCSQLKRKICSKGTRFWEPGFIDARVDKYSGALEISIAGEKGSHGVTFTLSKDYGLVLRYDWYGTALTTTVTVRKNMERCNLVLGDPTVENVVKVLNIFKTKGRAMNGGDLNAPPLRNIFKEMILTLGPNWDSENIPTLEDILQDSNYGQNLPEWIQESITLG